MKLSELSTSLSQTHIRTPQKVIVFGDAKTGKTELVGELARHGFILDWFDVENGHETLLKLPPEAQANINLFRIPDTRDNPQAQDTLRRILRPGKYDICEKHGKVGCMLCKKEGATFSIFDHANLNEKHIVVIDSLTQVSNSALAVAMKGLDVETKPEWDHYAKQGFILDDILGRVQSAPFHVCIITHTTETEMLDGKEKLVPYAGTRNFARNVSRYFGHSIYLYTSNKQHKAASSSTFSTQIATGSRSDISMEKLEQASLVDIFTYGKGK